jgi:hypothetical protein
MKLRDKFTAFKNTAFVRKMVIDSVYGSMQLEGQGVLRVKIERMYDEVQEEKRVSASKSK